MQNLSYLCSRISYSCAEVDTSHKFALGASGQGNVALPPQNVAMNTVNKTVCPPIIPSTQQTLYPVSIDKDEIAWYPMRIAHTKDSATMKLKSYLDDQGIENFLPMTYKEDFSTGKRHIRLLPAVSSLIFIHLDQNTLTDVKRSQMELLPLRYYMRNYINRPPEIVHVPDKQMDNFMKVASVQDDSVIYLGDKDFSKKIGRPVRIIGGIFEGVEGVVYRVKKDRRVVVSIEGIASVAIACISPDLLVDL